MRLHMAWNLVWIGSNRIQPLAKKKNFTANGWNLEVRLCCRKNFQQLDIFYRELSFDKIDQQKAFTFESLQGEVGGFMGLLLGL